MSDTPPPIDVTPEQWVIVRRILREHVRHHEVRAFGSRATWTAKPYSDLDLVVMTDKPLPPARLAALREAFTESDLPWKVDVVDRYAVSDALRAEAVSVRMADGGATRTGGRPASTGVIVGDVALSVGRPDLSLPDGWHWTPLSDVARLETGHTPSRRRPEWWGGDIPWIGIKDATGNHGRTIHDTIQHTNSLGIANSSARVLPAHTVCLSRTASVGYVVVMGRPMATSQDFVNWVCGAGLDWRYLKFVLLAERDAYSRFATGSTHQTIYFPEVKAFHVALPRRDEQDAIADVLQVIDDRIDLNRRMATTLERMAKALFRSWFVDFDPVWAKIEGRSTGLPDRLAALFPDAFDDDEVGQVPAGWATRAAGQVAQVFGGATPSTKEPAYWHGGEHAFCTPRDMAGLPTPVLTSTARHLTSAGVERISSGILPAGTVLMSSRAPIGYLAISDIPVSVNQGIIAMRPRLAVTNAYILLWCDANMATIKAHATGSTFAEISKRNFKPLPMLVPPAEVVDAFDDLAGPVLQRIAGLTRAMERLTALRDTLLPKLLSGEVRVPLDRPSLERVG